MRLIRWRHTTPRLFGDVPSQLPIKNGDEKHSLHIQGYRFLLRYAARVPDIILVYTGAFPLFFDASPFHKLTIHLYLL